MSNRQLLFDRPVPNGWRVMKVDALKADERSSCAAGPFGSNISSKYFVDEGIPVIRGSSLRDDLTRFVPKGFVFVSPERAKEYKGQHVRAGDLVFTCWGTLGQVGLIPKNGPFPEYIISNKQLKLRPNKTLAEPLYLFYYFACPQMVKHIQSIAIGAAVPGINLGILKNLDVVLPPLTVQRKILSILSAYDDLIENNTRRIAILEEMAQSVYREWFVAFRFPGHEKVQMVDSPLGNIPKGWEVKNLKDICHLIMGQSPKSEFYNKSGEGLPFHQGVTNFGRRFPTHCIYSTVVNRIAKPGDILFSVRAPVGRINVADTKLIVGRGISAIRHKDNCQLFLLHQLSEKFSEEDTMGGGTIFKAVTKEDMQGIKLLSPQKMLVDQFEKIVEPMVSQYANLTKRNHTLRTTRDLLLPKLISGQLDVENMDISSNEVLVEDAA